MKPFLLQKILTHPANQKVLDFLKIGRTNTHYANSLFHRIQNALEAVRIAKDYPNGGVYMG